MAENIGSIEVVASINTKGYDNGKKYIEKGNKDLEDSSEKSAKNASSKWDTAFKAISTAAIAGIAATTAATVALTTAAVKGYAEYEQLVGGVDTLFKRSSKTVQAYADTAYRTAGLSANEYMETVTSFSASLLQGLGGDTVKAAKIADKAITDMADNANKMGTSIEMIQNAYQGFAKDNFTMLDNLKLGYGGTAGEMARLVNESGVMGKSFKATAENVAKVPFDKLIEAIHVVQTEMGITGTTALEASETISGSFASMTASWQNLVSGLANPNANFNKLMSEFTTSALTFAGNVIPAIATALGSIVQLIDTFIPGFSGFISKVGDLGKEVGAYLTPKLEGLWTVIQKDLIPAFKSLWKSYIEPLAPVIGKLLVGAIGIAIDSIKQLASWISDLSKFISNNVQFFKALAVGVATAAAAVLVYNTYVKAAAIVSGIWAAATSVLSLAISLQAQGLGIARAAWLALNIAMNASPIGIVATALGALIGLIVLLSGSTKTLTADEKYLNDIRNQSAEISGRVLNAENALKDSRNEAARASLAVERAERSLADAVKQYGKESLEAREASLDLDDAKSRAENANNSLKTNTEELTQAQRDQVSMVQNIINKLDTLNGKSINYTIEGQQFVAFKQDGKSYLSGGFSSGGFTGRGGKYEPKGTVHGGEFVLTKDMVNQSTGMPDWNKIIPSMAGSSSASQSMPSRVLGSMGSSSDSPRTEYNIQKITISSEVDGERWLRRLTNDQEIVSNGLVPQQTYMGAN